MAATTIGVRILTVEGIGAAEAYFTLSDQPSAQRTELTPNVFVHVDAQGATVGVELSLPAKAVPYPKLISQHGVSVTTAALMKALVPHLADLSDDMDISITNASLPSPKF